MSMESDTKVYSYGAKAPIENIDLIREQNRLVRAMRNKWIEVERAYRASRHAAVLAKYPNVAEAECAAQHLSDLVEADEQRARDANQEARKRVVGKDEKAAIKARKSAKEKAWALYHELYGKVWNEEEYVSKSGKKKKRKVAKDKSLRLALEHLGEVRKADIAKVRDDSGTYSGFSEMEKVAFNQSCGKKAPPDFVKFKGHIKWGQRTTIQVKKGSGSTTAPFPVSRLLQPNTKAWIEHLGSPAPELQTKGRAVTYVQTFQAKSGVTLRRRNWALLHFRINSDINGKPIWTTVPFHMHRDLPAGSQICSASIIADRLGAKDEAEWKVQFVVKGGTGEDDRAKDGAMGIELGWRVVPEGLRVATWAADDGGVGDITIPVSMMDRWKYVDELKARRQVAFNEIADQILDWMAPMVAEDVPLLAKLQFLKHPKRSPRRLANLVKHLRPGDPSFSWRSNRIAGDESVFEAAETWRKADRRLLQEQVCLDEKCADWRKYAYRQFAADMRRRYRAVVFKNINWALQKRKKSVEDASYADEMMAKNRRFSSPGMLSRMLVESFREVIKVPPKSVAKTCNACGAEHEADPSKQHHTCDACGQQWDTDANEAKNVLDAASTTVET